MGGLGITNPCHIAASEYEASTAITGPLVEQIVAQTHELPDDHAIRTLQQCNRRDKDARLREDLEEVKNALPEQTKRGADLEENVRQQSARSRTRLLYTIGIYYHRRNGR